jgi:hypothetical protein
MKTVTAEQLKQITELTNGVPQEYKAKCFELLLAHALQTLNIPNGGVISKQSATPPAAPALNPKPFLLPIDVKAFLSQYKLNEAKLWKLFFVDGADVRSIYQLKTTKKATIQIHYALLMALENALSKGDFQVDIEALRTKCVEQKSYDKINFMTTLKSNQKLFKSVEKEQPLILSPDGKSDLADLIEELSNN